MEDNERDEMFKDLIEDTKKRICELNEEGAEVSRSLMAYTMCKLIMDKQFVEILTENKVELKDFIDVISHLFYAANGWFGDSFEEEHKAWKDLYFDYVHPLFSAISECHEWLENINDDLHNVFDASIANILRANIEGLTGNEILIWLENGEGWGYDVMCPTPSYVALREHLGIGISDPSLLNQVTKSITSEELGDNPERILADYVADMSEALDIMLPALKNHEFLEAFRAEHRDLCNLLFGMGVMQTTMIPKHIDLSKIIEDEDKLEKLGEFIYSMLGGDLKESIEKTNDIKTCKEFLVLGVRVNALAIDQCGSGLYGAGQGAIFDATLDMETEK